MGYVYVMTGTFTFWGAGTAFPKNERTAETARFGQMGVDLARVFKNTYFDVYQQLSCSVPF